MAATITQIVQYAIGNVPAEWSAIISKADMRETLTGDTIRVFDSNKPVFVKTARATIFQHGEINDQTWSSNLGYKGEDTLVVTSKKITIIKGSRKMVVFLTWYPNAGYGIKIAVYNK